MQGRPTPQPGQAPLQAATLEAGPTLRHTQAPESHAADTVRGPAAVRGLHLIVKSHACSRLCLILQARDQQQAHFNWTKQWYPIASDIDLDPSKPHAMMLLGAPCGCDGVGRRALRTWAALTRDALLQASRSSCGGTHSSNGAVSKTCARTGVLAPLLHVLGQGH